MRQNAMSAVFNAILNENRVASAVMNEIERTETEEAVESFVVDILMAWKEFALRVLKETVTILYASHPQNRVTLQRQAR